MSWSRVVSVVCPPYSSAAVIFSSHFQLSDSFGHFIVTFARDLRFEVAPILTGALVVGEQRDHIDNAVPPSFLMPYAPDLRLGDLVVEGR